jgi:hypothetical protein
MVYLLHFDRPFKHARHFVGATKSVTTIKALLQGSATNVQSPLVDAARADGVAFVVARTWLNGYARTNDLPNRHNLGVLCPVCQLGAKRRRRP